MTLNTSNKALGTSVNGVVYIATKYGLSFAYGALVGVTMNISVSNCTTNVTVSFNSDNVLNAAGLIGGVNKYSNVNFINCIYNNSISGYKNLTNTSFVNAAGLLAFAY
jgi:hypothetical protein